MPLARTLRFSPTPWRNASTLLAILACAPLAQSQSLVELAERARGFDAVWQARQAETDAAYSRSEQARAGLLPSVGLQAGASRARTEISRPDFTLNASTQTATLSASQPLYRPANRIAFTQGQRSFEIALAQRDAAEQDLIVRTSQAYFDVLGAEDALRFVQAQKQAVSEQRAFAQRNFDVGNATITDAREAHAGDVARGFGDALHGAVAHLVGGDDADRLRRVAQRRVGLGRGGAALGRVALIAFTRHRDGRQRAAGGLRPGGCRADGERGAGGQQVDGLDDRRLGEAGRRDGASRTGFHVHGETDGGKGLAPARRLQKASAGLPGFLRAAAPGSRKYERFAISEKCRSEK